MKQRLTIKSLSNFLLKYLVHVNINTVVFIKHQMMAVYSIVSVTNTHFLALKTLTPLYKQEKYKNMAANSNSCPGVLKN